MPQAAFDRGPDAAQPVGTARAFAIVFCVVLAASLFGILTRPMGFLAAFWPANAILLGMMVRWPALAALPSWAAAFAGYMAADLMTGGDPWVTLWLTAANMTGAATGFVLFNLLPPEDRALRRQLSVLYLLAVCAATAGMAALAGGGAARLLFDRDFATGLEFWFVTELVNSLVILPIILTLPDWRGLKAEFALRRWMSGRWWWRVAPLATLALSAAGAMLVGGPGAIAFTVLALVWCALTYSMFLTALVTGLLCAGLLISSATGLLPLPMSSDVFGSTSSVRLGVALIAIAPLTVSAINQAREELLARLSHAVTHDALTGVLSRRAFMDKGYDMVARLSARGAPVALLMLDIDHFKRVNDAHGHAGGDRVLVEFARRVGGELRPGDLLGRLGGEEFAVVLRGAGAQEAIAVAERIRAAVEAGAVAVAPDAAIRISVSIGVAVIDGVAGACLDKLLVSSDGALYGAKADGRNTVRVAA